MILLWVLLGTLIWQFVILVVYLISKKEEYAAMTGLLFWFLLFRGAWGIWDAIRLWYLKKFYGLFIFIGKLSSKVVLIRKKDVQKYKIDVEKKVLV